MVFDDVPVVPPLRDIVLQLDLSLPPRAVYALLVHRFYGRLLHMPFHRVTPFALLASSSASLFAALALAGCSSASGPELRASSPVIYVSSHRSSSDVLSCLEDKLPSLSTSKTGGVSELLVGPNAWLVTLTPSQYGSTVKVQKSEGEYGGLPEPEMRFNIARCTT